MPAFKSPYIDPDLLASIRTGSPLGNPFRPDQSLDQAIKKYNDHFQRQMLSVNPVSMEFARLIGLLAEQKHITLCCWCAKQLRPPYKHTNHRADACHADIIGIALLEILGVETIEYVQVELL